MPENSRIPLLLAYFEPYASGQTTHLLSLCKHIDRHRFDVTVLLPFELAELKNEYKETGVNVFVGGFSRRGWKPEAKRILKDWIAANPRGIVHIHSQDAGLFGRIHARKFGAKIILYTPHTVNVRRQEFSGLYHLLERMLAKITDRIISVNLADVDTMVSWGIPRQKVLTIYNGIDLNVYDKLPTKDQAKAELAVPPEKRVVLQIGRLNIQKNPIAFVRGAELVLQQKPGTVFVMVGEGPLKSDVDAAIRNRGLGGSVITPGNIHQAYRLIPAADVVSLTSSWEGLPYTILEAMACAKPSVATDVNGCREVVIDGETGFLTPAGDVEAWASSVIELLDKPDLADKYGKNARSLLEEKFTLATMIHNLESLYQGLFDEEAIK
ncbi:MAG TPA: glycosyltransferase [Bellilinea sp.]|nr:glycosyltransferase [Bellilinea sp.]